jgi:hypothetical protein
MGDLVPIYSAADLVQAQLLRDELEEHGISAWVINESLQGAVGQLPAGWSSNPRVVVERNKADEARAVAVEFDRLGARRIASRDVEPVRPIIEPDPWPCCPMCSERRLAVCRICSTASTRFPIGYQGPGESEDKEPLLLVCTTCDEPFVPRFYKRCEHCGFEFEDGVDLPRPTREPEMVYTDMARVWVVIAGMVALFAVFAAYLRWLMRE